MTPIFFLLFYGIGLVLTFVRHPIYGLYTYLFVFYLAPNDQWWSRSVPDLRYLFIAGIIAILATLRMPKDTDRAKWHQTTPARLFILYILYNWLQIAWAIDRDVQFDTAFLFSKHLIIFYLMYRLSDSLEQIRILAIIHVVGCAWFGYQAFDVSGGRLEEIGGAVAGSNKLGVHVATALLFGGMLLLVLRGARRWIVFASLPLVANTLVLTISRGAFLGFFSGGIAGYFLVPKRLKKAYLLLGILGLILVAMLSHNALIDRFTETFLAVTSEEQELDRSATSRIDIAKAGIAIGLDHPFGAGSKATERLSAPYITGWDHGRAAHNTLAEIFAEHGFPGLIIYLLIVAWVIRTSFRIKRELNPKNALSEEVGILAAIMGSSLLAVYFAGNFSSNQELETQYWCLALLAAIYELHKKIRLNPQAQSMPITKPRVERQRLKTARLRHP